MKKEKALEVIPPVHFDKGGMPVLNTTDDIYNLARWMHRMKLVSEAFKEPNEVCLALLYARSLDLNPVLALRQMYPVNGLPQIYGDLPLALVKRAKRLTYIKETWITNEKNEVVGARCETKNADTGDVVTTTFTIDDAIAADLWDKPFRSGKRSIWQKYPKRMLKMRARTENLKDQAPDILSGIPILEYDGDTEPNPMKDVTPGGAESLMNELRDDKAPQQGGAT